jgi:stage V sporulation protein B
MIRKSLLLFSVNAAGRLFQYLYRVAMSYFLSLKEFGMLSASLPYQSFVLLLTSMSVTPTASKFTSQYKVEEEEKIFNVFSLVVMGLIIGAILYASTGVITQFFGADFAGSQDVLKILALAVPCAVFLSVCTGIFLGFEKAYLMAASLMVYQCVMLGSSYLLVQYRGLTGAAMGIFVGYLASAVMAVILVFRFRLSIQASIREMGRIVRFSLPVLVGVVGIWALLNIDIMILARFAPAEDVGVYGMAYPTARLLFGFSTALSALLVPRISELTYTGKDAVHSIRSSFEVCAVVTLPMAVTLAAFSKEILYVLFGNVDGSTALKILSLAMFVYSLFFIGYSALQGLGRPEHSMGSALVSAACGIGFCFILIPRFGMEGAALSTTAACFIGLALVLGFLKIRMVPRVFHGALFATLFIFEYFVGIPGGRVVTMTIYGAVGLPVIIMYFWLSRPYLRIRETEGSMDPPE